MADVCVKCGEPATHYAGEKGYCNKHWDKTAFLGFFEDNFGLKIKKREGSA